MTDRLPHGLWKAGLVAALFLAVAWGQFSSAQLPVAAHRRSDSSAVPSPVLVDAFQAGLALSRMVASSGSVGDFLQHRSQIEALLMKLRLHEGGAGNRVVEDRGLGLQEPALVRERLRRKMQSRHGVRVAATFVIGAEIVPATEAFVLYLTDPTYRAALIRKGISVADFGAAINENIDDAALPEEIKEKWPSLYGALIRDLIDPRVIQSIKVFREEILRHFSDF